MISTTNKVLTLANSVTSTKSVLFSKESMRWMIFLCFNVFRICVTQEYVQNPNVRCLSCLQNGTRKCESLPNKTLFGIHCEQVNLDLTPEVLKILFFFPRLGDELVSHIPAFSKTKKFHKNWQTFRTLVHYCAVLLQGLTFRATICAVFLRLPLYTRPNEPSPIDS